MKSLKAEHNKLADPDTQIAIIEHGKHGDMNLIPFQQKLEETGLYPIT